MSLRVGIVGCGRMGRKRAAALGDDELVGCYDEDPALAGELGPACDSLDAMLRLEPDAVVVAVTPDALSDVTCRALAGGANVLVEKPAGVSAADVERIAATSAETGRVAWVGFNHRFHPGIARAITDARSGAYGEVLHVRGRYGHGGRLGYEQEWRFDRARSGGGELVDQGMHLLDLVHAVTGPLPLHSALLRSSYWGGAVEDNAALLLGAPEGAFAVLHAGWTEWKNLFSLEIACRTAKLQVDGLAGSYGAQRLTVYRMKPELGPPDVETIEYAADDVSWREEWRAFKNARGDEGTLSARWAWRVVETAYERA